MTRVPPPVSSDLRQWAEAIRRYLGLALDQLGYKNAASSASEDGVILWDSENAYPVVSSGGEFRELFVSGNDIEVGNADFIITSPDGTRYKISVDNAGNITTAPI